MINCLHRDCCEKIDQYHIENEQIGKGSYGNIRICEKKVKLETCDNYAIKIQDYDHNTRKKFENEVSTMEFLYENNVSIPRIYDYWICGPKSYIIMQRIDGYTFEEIIAKKLELLDPKKLENLYKDLRLMNTLGIRHNDLHKTNIMYDKLTKKIYIIDFGRSEKVNLSKSKTTREADKFIKNIKNIFKQMKKYNETPQNKSWKEFLREYHYKPLMREKFGDKYVEEFYNTGGRILKKQKYKRRKKSRKRKTKKRKYTRRKKSRKRKTKKRKRKTKKRKNTRRKKSQKKQKKSRKRKTKKRNIQRNKSRKRTPKINYK